MVTQKYIQNDGDKVTWGISITNSSNSDCFGVSVVFTIPSGVSLTGPLAKNGFSIDVPLGGYNPATKTWTVGKVSANSSTTQVDWEFTVDDITEVGDGGAFSVLADVSSRCTGEDESNNQHILEIHAGVEECVLIDVSVGGQLP